MLHQKVRRLVGKFYRTCRPLGALYALRQRVTVAGSLQAPAFLREDYPLEWNMTIQERAALVQLLDFVAPPVALEVGTNHGGSLQVIAPRAGRAYALDINPLVPEWLGAGLPQWLGAGFPNVTFRIGDSREVLPRVLREIESRGEELGFVLIDGDHSGDSIRQDINALLRYTPRRPVYVLLHDSFNPECRAGMLAADWQACPHVHYLQLDFVGGLFVPMPKGLEMWGGFGLALLLPQTRTGAFTPRQAGKPMFDVLHGFSRYAAAAA